jgi:hypothetical protein
LLFYYDYLFGPAAAPFSVVWADNGVTVRSGLSRNVALVWSFSRFWVNRRLLSFIGFQSGPIKVVQGIDSYAFLND